MQKEEVKLLLIICYLYFQKIKCILGAFGYFEVTHDISKYCKADVFSSIGKQTPVAVRFSTVGGESGSADTVRYLFLCS